MTVHFDPRDPAVIADPYPSFQRLREEDPIHWCETLGGWVLTRYDDVKAVQRDRRFSADRITPFADHVASGEWRGDDPDRIARMAALLKRWAVFNDPPRHTILRRVMIDAFSPRAIEALRPLIRNVVNTLVDELDARDGFDLIADFAYPLPATIIAHILGVPEEDIGRFRQWSEDLAGVVGSARLATGRYERGAQALFALTDYFEGIVADRRRGLGEGLGQGHDAPLIDRLIAAHDQGEDTATVAPLTEAELVANAILILFAGHETTTNLIGNGMVALARNIDQMQKLRAEPALIDSTVEEILRYDGPAQTIVRIATENIALRDRRIAEGDRVFLMLNAANRDPRIFDNPERFDISRGDARHIAFGYGIHFCVGAQLARTEGQIAIAALIDRLPGSRLVDTDMVWDDSLVLRGVKRLPIRNH